MPPSDVNSLIHTAGIAYGGSGGGGINWANFIGGFIFGCIGFVSLTYGHKEKNYKVFSIGVLLSVYPWFVPNTFLVYLIGISLTSALYFWRD